MAKSTPVYCTPFFFFNDTATTEIYTLSLHDALPILKGFGFCVPSWPTNGVLNRTFVKLELPPNGGSALNCSSTSCSTGDRKSTRLNSSHANISYAVFCLKKKKPSS